MLDFPEAATTGSIMAALRRTLDERPPSLPTLFQAGDAIADHTPMLPAGETPQRVAVLGAATIDYLRRAVACAIVQEGVFPVIYQAPFGAYVQEILDSGSGLHDFAPDLVVIAPLGRDLLVDLPVAATAAELDAAQAATVDLFRSLWRVLAQRGVRIMQHLLLAPAGQYRGVADRQAPASAVNQVRRLNDALIQAAGGRVTWVDMPALAESIGTRRFSPAKFYYAAKLEHDPKFLPDYLPRFRAAWRSANARAKKVLVLDLDDTLWGGVIGDDGAAGIRLGPGTPAGQAFSDWQRYVAGLRHRGVILAVCSKNDPSVARTGFDHPNSVLKQDDFAAFDCAWSDKAAGLRRIAAALNVGLDSFVFCDDNPAECDLVRQELPEVAAVCMGPDPAAFIDLFDAGHWFDMDAYTTEDFARAAAYAARAAALAEQAGSSDLAGYLRGLRMTAHLGPAQEADIVRLAQLELKTNQFNVTTRRYSEAALRQLIARDDAVILAFRLADRFGDHGLTSTLVAVHQGDALRIDSWLMSCRVFARSAEPFILRALIGIARDLGAVRLLGEYLPTDRNAVVADLFPRLGFQPVGDGRFVRAVAQPMDDLVTFIAPAGPGGLLGGSG